MLTNLVLPFPSQRLVVSNYICFKFLFKQSGTFTFAPLFRYTHSLITYIRIFCHKVGQNKELLSSKTRNKQSALYSGKTLFILGEGARSPCLSSHEN